jgi:prepilin-type N-terminal cleavage/methylation domain-containing protein
MNKRQSQSGFTPYNNGQDPNMQFSFSDGRKIPSTKKNRLSTGFTLIEVLVAATIISILTVIGVVSFSSTNLRARDGKRRGDLEQTRAALELYRSDDSAGAGKYPSGAVFTTMTSTLKTAKYLSDPLPVDPRNDVSLGYIYNYTAGATQTSYCMCSKFEQTNAGNSTTTDCSNIGNMGTGQYYCLVNP